MAALAGIPSMKKIIRFPQPICAIARGYNWIKPTKAGFLDWLESGMVGFLFYSVYSGGMFALYLFSGKLIFFAIMASVVSAYFLYLINTIDSIYIDTYFIELFGQQKEKQEAARIDTSPESLAVLSRHSNKRVRRLTAQNPNTSPAVLIQLAVEFPLEVVTNPSFGLALIEFPNFFDRVHEGVWFHSQLPPELFVHALTNPSHQVRCMVASRSDTESFIVERLSMDADCRVRKAVLERNNDLQDVLPATLERLRSDRCVALRRVNSRDTCEHCPMRTLV
jgi:hypothetical protein